MKSKNSENMSGEEKYIGEVDVFEIRR